MRRLFAWCMDNWGLAVGVPLLLFGLALSLVPDGTEPRWPAGPGTLVFDDGRTSMTMSCADVSLPSGRSTLLRFVTTDGVIGFAASGWRFYPEQP